VSDLIDNRYNQPKAVKLLGFINVSFSKHQLRKHSQKKIEKPSQNLM
jgi:hypothetical protein